MLKRTVILSTLILLGASFAQASDRDDDVARTPKASPSFPPEIMNTPDQGIPHDLLIGQSA